MTKSMTAVLTIVALLGLAVGANAALIGYWDAEEPGSTPTTTWEDLTTTGYDLAADQRASGSGLPTYNDPGDYYNLDTHNGFVGTGASSVYDFDTALGTSTDPFSINIYMHASSWSWGASGYNIVSKTDEPGNGLFEGYVMAIHGDSNSAIDFSMQPGTNTARMYDRQGTAGSVVGRDMMLTLTTDGSGTAAGTTLYVDGVAMAQGYQENTLNASIMNSGLLRLGQADIGGPTNEGIDANVYFLGIYNEELSAQQVSDRYNSGSPLRGLSFIPEPATMALLGLGGLMVLRRRRSA